MARGRVPDRFQAHPAARLIGPDGALGEGAGGAAGPIVQVPDGGAALIDPARCADAVRAALAQGAAGLPFRVGALDLPAPAPGRRPVFEALTSGTTGVPRRIRRTQRSWCASFAVNAGLFGIGPGQRVAVLGRMVHSLSLYGALEGACLGAEVHLLAGLRPDGQRAALAARGVEVLYATPAQLRLVVEAGGGALPGLRLVLVGGAKLDTALRAALAVLAPQAEVREFYGAAEASFVTLADPASRPDGVGRPYPGVRLEVRAADGTVLGPGGVGEIWVKSPYLCDRYGDRRGTAPLKRRGWLSVGEMGWMEGGELHLAGRLGRMVTVADQNVFPEEIERILLECPGVRRVAVVPRADALRGHVLVAVVQGDPAQEAAILRAARARLGPLKAPRALIWRDDWPETASGKADLVRIASEAGL
ncbi:AMP-binding protein [Paragemmobacter ruber]|uniref:AMP-binding protein n=1 Tax=Paragemmobacter ruber TaxID=1985673 RepID=A0ABW9Y8B0_9RHOB|nr:AMP-binding protein [Rhodobacter ruber]NBE08059.1 AMP-binding protein [Rhodobacter ruber]